MGGLVRAIDGGEFCPAVVGEGVGFCGFGANGGREGGGDIGMGAVDVRLREFIGGGGDEGTATAGEYVFCVGD